ncbi:MAG: ABC transporter ATP-binding protein/permease [Clostridia bacterium]|nr:ABC transporter ATP-binding protein/permease [Clostridia bacterium]
MLKLKEIKKTYVSGDESVDALKGIDLNFRRCEFVSILGPSGCGKTTLLNIIGGLDGYTSGDLVINGISTKNYDDRDFDAYRNHSIGFVFQSYNLITHQTVLANVELALTLSGVSRAERRRRAEDALRKVGLADQMKKKPNQLSGGQMQRVAIARALVNDPDILLADEPTGALDSATSVQIMDILREIANDKLVIMVTHNPELASEYSTRIIKLLDGKVISDSDPFEGDKHTDENTVVAKGKKEKKVPAKKSMSFFTALSLSFNNLMTKKTRTFLTSFAGSIGIIGIALILSVSTGVNAFIDDIQNDTLISYPLTINAESDMTSVLANFMARQNENDGKEREEGYVYSRDILFDMMESVNNRETNNLTAFKKFIDSSEEMQNYATTIRYSYANRLSVYTKDPNGKIIVSDMEEMMTEMMSSMGMNYDGSSGTMASSPMMSMGSVGVWQEMLPGGDGELINPAIIDNYEVVHGEWPDSFDEAVLVVNQNCEISDYVLYGLGLKPYEEMIEIMKSTTTGASVKVESDSRWTFDDILNIDYRLVYSSDRYVKQSDGTYVDISDTETGLNMLYESRSTPIKIVGIVRANEDATATMLTGAIAYTSALTDKLIDNADASDIIKDQLADPSLDVITGKPFKPETPIELTDAEKSEKFNTYVSGLEADEKAEFYKTVLCTPTAAALDRMMSEYLSTVSRDELQEYMIESYAAEMGVADKDELKQYFESFDDSEFISFFRENAAPVISEMYYNEAIQKFDGVPSDQIIMMFENTPHTEAELAEYYDVHVPSEYAETTLEENLLAFGYVDREKPTSISIYVETFEDKDAVSDIIAEYNASVSEDDQIKYTDYFAIMMSSVSTVLNAISYVLVAFVSISLVVSSIMIGIITYISVLERTKEIGILRAIGASKKDISRVFNAETLTVGFVSGALGIIISFLLTIPINAIIHHLTGFNNLSAQLPIAGAVILVIISMVLTFIAGLIPSGIAAKKDPVVALRSE